MSTEFKLQASIKDADGDMVNFRADSPEELDAYLGGFPYAGYAAAKAALRGAGAAAPIVQPAAGVPQAQPVQQAPQQSAWGGQAQPAAAAVQQSGPVNGQPHPENKQCACGTVLQWKAFTSKAGKNLKLWTCPNGRSQGDGHDSEFVW